MQQHFPFIFFLSRETGLALKVLTSLTYHGMPYPFLTVLSFSVCFIDKLMTPLPALTVKSQSQLYCQLKRL